VPAGRACTAWRKASGSPHQPQHLGVAYEVEPQGVDKRLAQPRRLARPAGAEQEERALGRGEQPRIHRQRFYRIFSTTLFSGTLGREALARAVHRD
jgi:hypothetical protein